jgi:predicted ATP-grasp superfamily ATP-dependent carboligase
MSKMFERLDENLLNDQNAYYFNFLSDRFHPLHSVWEANLKKRFGLTFKPIFVLPAVHNELFSDENYIVLNESLEAVSIDSSPVTPAFAVLAADDFNRQFSHHQFVRELIAKLLTKQDQVFVLSLTSVGLAFDSPKVQVLGPDPEVAARFDDKAEHLNVFRHLGLPTNQTWLYASYEELKAKHTEYPFFLSAAFSSAGSDSCRIETSHDLAAYFETLRPANKSSHFIAAKFLTDIVSAPNASAIVLSENNTLVVCITDQILRGHRYLGNIYPSSVGELYRAMILEMTTAVGNYLSTQGFRGLFGLDFLVTSAGNCYPLDLNPRRQGSYHCNVMMSKEIDLIDLEQRAIFGETLPVIKHEQFEVSYCWAHNKIMPYRANPTLGEGFEIGAPLKPFDTVGSRYASAWYPKGSILKGGAAAHYLRTDMSRSRLLETLEREVDELITQLYTYPDSSSVASD